MAAARKAKQWQVQFHACQWSLQRSLYFANSYRVPHVNKEAVGGKDRERSSDRAETDGEEERLSRQRWFTMSDQIIGLHLQYHHCRLTFLRACEITHERLFATQIQWAIQRSGFSNIILFWGERSHGGQPQVEAVKTFCGPLNDTGHNSEAPLVHQGHLQGCITSSASY